MPDKGKMREWLINKKSKKIKEFKYLENKTIFLEQIKYKFS